MNNTEKLTSLQIRQIEARVIRYIVENDAYDALNIDRFRGAFSPLRYKALKEFFDTQLPKTLDDFGSFLTTYYIDENTIVGLIDDMRYVEPVDNFNAVAGYIELLYNISTKQSIESNLKTALRTLNNGTIDETLKIIDDISLRGQTYATRNDMEQIRDYGEIPDVYESDKTQREMWLYGIPVVSDFIKMRPKNLGIIAGRPGDGKTAWAQQSAERIAVANNITTALFSLELSVEEIEARVIARYSGLPFDDVYNKTIDFNSRAYLKAREKLSEMKNLVKIIPAPGKSVDNLTKFQKWVEGIIKEYNIKVAFFDYLSLIPGNTGDRFQDAYDACYGLEALGNELNVCFWILAQLGRSADGKKDLTFSQLADTSALERVSDVIAALVKEKQNDSYMKNTKKMKLAILKNRSGKIDNIPLLYDGEKYQFTPVNKTPSGFSLD